MTTTTKTAIVDIPDCYGMTKLRRATWARDITAVEYLLAAGADINARNKDGFTLLQSAAMSGNLPWAQLLLNHGADPGTLDLKLQQTAHAYAVQYNHKLIADLIEARKSGQDGQ